MQGDGKEGPNPEKGTEEPPQGPLLSTGSEQGRLSKKGLANAAMAWGPRHDGGKRHLRGKRGTHELAHAIKYFRVLHTHSCTRTTHGPGSRS